MHPASSSFPPPPSLFGSALFLAGTVLLPSAWRAVSLSDLFGSDSSIRSPRGHGSFFFFFFFVKVLGANCRQSSFVNDFLVKCMLSVIASRGRLEVGISYRIMRGVKDGVAHGHIGTTFFPLSSFLVQSIFWRYRPAV